MLPLEKFLSVGLRTGEERKSLSVDNVSSGGASGLREAAQTRRTWADSIWARGGNPLCADRGQSRSKSLGGFCSNQSRSCSGVSSRNSGVSRGRPRSARAPPPTRRAGPRGAPCPRNRSCARARRQEAAHRNRWTRVSPRAGPRPARAALRRTPRVPRIGIGRRALLRRGRALQPGTRALAQRRPEPASAETGSAGAVGCRRPAPAGPKASVSFCSSSSSEAPWLALQLEVLADRVIEYSHARIALQNRSRIAPGSVQAARLYLAAPGAIAQFGRAPGSHPGGRRFEPG